MRVNNHNIAFTSKIRFVDGETFNKLIEGKKDNEAGRNENINSSKTTDNEVYAMGSESCVMGGFQNGDQIFMYHLLPRLHVEGTPGAIQTKNRFSQEKDNLSRSGNTIKGFIAGGIFGFAPNSLRLFKTIRQNYGNLGIKFSYIWGKKAKTEDVGDKRDIESLQDIVNRENIRDNLHYSVKTDTWSIWHEGDPIKTVQDLKKTYEHIFINYPTDHLFIGSTEITPKEAPDLFVDKLESAGDYASK